MEHTTNITETLHCAGSEDVLSRNYFVILVLSGSIVMSLTVFISVLCLCVVIDAFKVKCKVSLEENDTRDEESAETEENSNLKESYENLPSYLTITKVAKRKLSRLSSLAKSSKIKDAEEASKILELVVNTKIRMELKGMTDIDVLIQ